MAFREGQDQDQGQGQGLSEGQDEYSDFGIDQAEAEVEAEAGIQPVRQDGKGKGKGKERDTFEQAWSSAQHPVQPGHIQSQTDGADVLDLLTSPTFNADFPDADNEQIPNDLSDYTPDTASTGLSPSELQTLHSFRRSQDQSQPQQAKISSSSLIPDIDDFLSNVPPSTAETDLRDAVLTGLSGSEDWVSVEERYHDEVWGFLKPALQAAQNEIQAKEDGQDPSGQGDGDGPAVARLKMILRHM